MAGAGKQPPQGSVERHAYIPDNLMTQVYPCVTVRTARRQGQEIHKKTRVHDGVVPCTCQPTARGPRLCLSSNPLVRYLHWSTNV